MHEEKNGMPPQKALIIVNRNARSGDADLQPALDIFNARGIESSLARTAEPDDIRSALREHGDQIDCIVVGGGDGTLNASLSNVLESGLPLGILPLGTGNDLARTLNIPFSLAEAAKIIATGNIKRIDLGKVNGNYFFNVANIGLAVKVTHALTGRMKKKWGPLAYLLALIDAYRSNRPFRARVTCDGKRHRLKSIQITIGNGRHYGGGMAVRDNARIDDRRLDCYSLEPQSLWELVKAGPSIARGTFENRQRVRLMDGKEFEILTRKPMPVSVDGELKTHTPARFIVEGGILPVFAP